MLLEGDWLDRVDVVAFTVDDRDSQYNHIVMCQFRSIVRRRRIDSGGKTNCGTG